VLPPPPPDPSTLPVSVIRPLSKTADTPPPKTDAGPSVIASGSGAAKPTRRPSTDAPNEPVETPTQVPARVPQSASARVEPARSAVDAATATATPTSATADGSANGYVFFTGMGIAGIILALSFVGYMRAGNDSGRPRP
jgi:hypothetical protein